MHIRVHQILKWGFNLFVVILKNSQNAFNIKTFFHLLIKDKFSLLSFKSFVSFHMYIIPSSLIPVYEEIFKLKVQNVYDLFRNFLVTSFVNASVTNFCYKIFMKYFISNYPLVKLMKHSATSCYYFLEPILSKGNASSTAFVETQDSTEKLKRWIFVGLFRNWPVKT